ncbi:MAG: DnaJ domain-containing protein [Hyphomicrobiaceae bacterium]
MRNFYKVLGIATTADDQRIKTAFRRRAKSVHPDVNPGNQRAEARFIELMQAYKILRDAETRAEYDAYLAERRSQSRRRLVHCAGLMMTSFMLTATSAIFLMSMAGANVPFRESWQLAIAAVSPGNAKAPAAQSHGQKDGAGWIAQVAVAPASDGPVPPPDRVVSAPDAKAPSKPPTAKSRQGAPDSPGSRAKDTRQHVATGPKQAPSAVKRWEPPPSSTSDESWPSFPSADEPRYSLGASDLR